MLRYEEGLETRADGELWAAAQVLGRNSESPRQSSEPGGTPDR